MSLSQSDSGGQFVAVGDTVTESRRWRARTGRPSRELIKVNRMGGAINLLEAAPAGPIPVVPLWSEGFL